VPAAPLRLTGSTVSWPHEGRTITQPLRLHHTYVLPSGYKVHLEKPRRGPHAGASSAPAECTLCHKPCTVSGGGKSEISKSHRRRHSSSARFSSPTSPADLDAVAAILLRDYSTASATPRRNTDRRPLLSPERSLGSVIKLLTPSPADYTDEYNAWLEHHPALHQGTRLVVKRFLPPRVGRRLARALQRRYRSTAARQRAASTARSIDASFLRVGFGTDGSWRTFGLRKDFHPASRSSRGRHHRLRRRPAPRLTGLPAASAVELRSSSSRTANTGSSSAPTTPSTAATTNADRARTSPPRQFLLQLRAAHRAQPRRPSSRTPSASTSSPSRCRPHPRLRRRPRGGRAYFVSAPPIRASSTASRRRTRATSKTARPRRPARPPTSPPRRAALPRGIPAGGPSPARRRRARRPPQQPARARRPRPVRLRPDPLPWSCPSSSWSSSQR
jgi:hypothetical protein